MEPVERFRGKMVDSENNGTIPQILGLVGLKLKTMVASGDSDPKVFELMGDKLLGHIWHPTTDKFIFKVTVNLRLNERKIGVRENLHLKTFRDCCRLH